MSLLDKTNLLITPNAVKAGKLYSVIPAIGNGDCTVVRNTTATRINGSGLIESVASNIPRINYDSAGNNPSVLVEVQRTNLIIDSENFGNWTLLAGATVNLDTTISPDGTLNADSINFDAQNVSRVEKNYNSAGGIHTFSVYLKVASGTKSVGIRAGSATISYFTVTSNFQRFSVTENVPAGTASPIIVNFGTESFTVFAWGAQVEQGSSATSFIPTTFAAVTRNADIITVSPPTGTVKITTTFSDNTTQVLTTIPSTFTIPDGLIKQVLMQDSL